MYRIVQFRSLSLFFKSNNTAKVIKTVSIKLIVLWLACMQYARQKCRCNTESYVLQRLYRCCIAIVSQPNQTYIKIKRQMICDYIDAAQRLLYHDCITAKSRNVLIVRQLRAPPSYGLSSGSGGGDEELYSPPVRARPFIGARRVIYLF